MERVELRPEHVALEAHGVHARLLLLARAGVRLDVVEREARVERRLHESLLEIGHHVIVDEIVVLEHPGDALLVDLGREQLGQRGGDRDDERLLDDEAHVGFDGEDGGGQGAPPRHHVLAVEAEAVGQHEPALDAAGVLAKAVVLEHAVDPVAPQLAVEDARDERGILARHGGLVAVAVERPRLHLPLVELAAVQSLWNGCLSW